MKQARRSLALTMLILILSAWPAGAEILAMLNYETKPEQIIRKEGIAIIDVDPKSPSFGKLIADIPLPPDLVAHHIFYTHDQRKAYITALGKSLVHVMDMTRFPYRLKVIQVPECVVGEDVGFSEDSKTWYLTCMGSNKVIVGDVASDRVTRVIDVPKYPHGIAIHDGIDRILTTSTVRASDLGDPGEVIAVIETSTGKVLSTPKVTDKPSPAGDAPVEVVFVPRANPPVAYIANMYGGTLSVAVWNPARKDFDIRRAFDFAPHEAGVPLEMYFNKQSDRLYITTAKPGKFHIFDISGDPSKPRLLKTLPAAAGAHHVAFTKDGQYAFVQNSLLNLPGMSDGSITVIDMKTQQVVGSVDTLKNQGLNPNCIVLLPEWNEPAGH